MWEASEAVLVKFPLKAREEMWGAFGRIAKVVQYNCGLTADRKMWPKLLELWNKRLNLNSHLHKISRDGSFTLAFSADTHLISSFPSPLFSSFQLLFSSTGHVFNMPHDNVKACEEVFGKLEDNHMMSPTLIRINRTSPWSPCSAAIITDYLDSGHGKSKATWEQLGCVCVCAQSDG